MKVLRFRSNRGRVRKVEGDAAARLIRAIMDAFIAGYVASGRPAWSLPTQALIAASRHAAKLVVEIDGATEAMIARNTGYAIAGNWTTEQLQDRIAELAFSRDRALRIARTEVVMMFNRGEVAALAADGIERVEVVDGDGCLPIGHDDNAPKAKRSELGVQPENEADGQTWTLAEVESGDLWVGHPNCRRALIEAA